MNRFRIGSMCILMSSVLAFVTISLPYSVIGVQHTVGTDSLQGQYHIHGDDQVLHTLSINGLSAHQPVVFHNRLRIHPFWIIMVKMLFWGLIITLIRKIIRHRTGYYDFKIIES